MFLDYLPSIPCTKLVMLVRAEVLVPGGESVVALVDAALLVLVLPLVLKAHMGNNCSHGYTHLYILTNKQSC